MDHVAEVTAAPAKWRDAGHDAPWHQLSVTVAGIGVSGAAAARVLAALGAHVTVVDARSGEPEEETATALRALGVQVRLGAASELPPSTELVVTSPGWRPDAALFVAAEAAGIEIWGEPELAWRLRRPGDAPWLVVTGTDGKTTTTMMLEAMLLAAGARAAAAGNIGRPLVETVNSGLDVLAVELGSFQLHWSPSVAPRAAAVLNVAPDHLDWHGTLDAYTAAKAGAYRYPATIAIGNADDPGSTRLLARAPGKRVSFTLHSPRPAQLGVVEDLLIDRAFVDSPENEAVELATLADVPVPGPHNVANALAAAALARAYGIEPAAVAEGLRRFRPAAHRIATVGEIDRVSFVDDSKATSPHAASAALSSFPSIVWVSGGLSKGVAFDEVVISAAPRLRGAVVFGACGSEIRDALARHAPQVRVVEVVTNDTEQVENVMDRVIEEAAGLAAPGDVVLLSPAAASMDMFRDYGHRGDVFSRAVDRRHARLQAGRQK
jgi:UDP-N-acetylmuramoylalanine--D-glutamate ligase